MVFTLSRLLIIMSFIPIANSSNGPQINNMALTDATQAKLAKLEAQYNGRLGVVAINTANNAQIQYRADERFPFCSTSKVMTVVAILKQSERQTNLLQKSIKYSQQDVDKSGNAPISKNHLLKVMSVNDLCQAAIDYSDNTAMNLLIKTLGGPQAVTSYARSIQDNKFSLNRWEPELNTAIPGDNRDTTTPYAMGNSLKQLVLGNALESDQQQQLVTWMKNNTTGNLRIRAGISKDWAVADKTGTGAYGTTNDIGVVWPTGCAPIILVIYFTQYKKDSAPRDEVIAAATKILINNFAHGDSCFKSR